MNRKILPGALSAPVVGLLLVSLLRCAGPTAPEPLAKATLSAVTSSVVEQAQHWAVKYTGTALTATNASEYTVSAIGPQTGCTGGALLLTAGAGTPEVQATLRHGLGCLDSPTGCTAPTFQNTQPPPGRFSGDECSDGYSNVQDEAHPNPEYLIFFIDSETARIGQTSFFHLATGLHQWYHQTPTSCVPNWTEPGAPPNSPYRNFVNYFRRSDNCGASWPLAGTAPAYQVFDWRDTNITGWNFDLSHIYVDPFNISSSGNYYAYIFGSVGTVVKGVVESGDQGTTWTQRGYIGGWGNFSHGGNMTSTSDGTQFYVGCIGTTPRLYYSYDRWATFSTFDLTWNGGQALCRVLQNGQWPGGAQQRSAAPYSVAISRLSWSNLTPDYARVRVAFPSTFTFGSNTRQSYRVLEVGVKRKGGSLAVAPYQVQVMELADTNTSYLEAGFVEPDPFDTPRGGINGTELHDTALFWTMEGNHSNQSMQFRYRVAQGPNTYSAPRDLSANSWAYDTGSGLKWNGDYNRSGAYYYDKNTKRYNYVLVWPQGNSAAPTLSTRVEPHYNVVSIQPSINSTTLNVEKLNFGTLASGPAVTSQGTNKLDIFWKDANGNLAQKSYANGWVAGTQSRGKPPGVSILKDPAVASWGANRLDVFVRGTDEKLWQWWWDGVDRGWALIDNGPIKAAPSVTDAGNGVLYVFALMADNSVKYRKYDHGWIPGWTSLGNAVVGAPVAINDGSVVHVFVRGADTRVWQKYTTDGGANWFGWFDLGGSFESNPAVSSWSAGRIDLFGRPYASEVTLLHRGFEAGWQQTWQDLLTNRGAALDWVGDPDAVSMAAMRTDVFARSSDNLLWHVWHVSPP